MAPESTIQASKEGEQTILLPIYDDYEPQQWLAQPDNPKGTIVACMLEYKHGNQQLSIWT